MTSAPLSLSASIMPLPTACVPQSFFDELRQKPAEPHGKVTFVAALSPEDRENLMEKLRRVVSDDEDCSVSRLSLLKDY